MLEKDLLQFPRTNVLPAEDPIEAIRGVGGGASEWEMNEEVAEEARLEEEGSEFLKEQAAFYHPKPPLTESRRRLIVRQLKAGQTRLPDIFRSPVPDRIIQYRMFSDLDLSQLRVRLKGPVAEPTSQVTSTGYPLYPKERMSDIINGTDYRY